VADKGYGIIARLNNGYSPDGTIPLSVTQFEDFATRLAWWVGNSEGCNHWIIGNEPNSSVEGLFDPSVYADCFRLCYDAIKAVQPESVIMPAPVAMWNAESGDWLHYYGEMLYACWPFDALCWHTYTHGSDRALITSMEKMGPPYETRLFQFRAYWDLWAATRAEYRNLGIYITETDQGDIGGIRNPWLDESGVHWIWEAYQEIDQFNRQHGYPIRCLACYRWPQYDEWHIEGKPHVHEDFADAVSLGFTWKEEDPVSEWTAAYTNHCDDYVMWGEHPQIKVLDGYTLGWADGTARPEMDYKSIPQREVYALDEPRSGVGFLPFATFDWWIRTEQPVSIKAGVPTKLAVALMIVAHGISGDPDKLGDCGMIIGISEPDIVDVNSTSILWSEWHTVRDPSQPGANMEEYVWKVAETIEFVPMYGQAHIWIRCVANVAADISAGHFDLIQILQKTDDTPPPTGNYRVVVYDPAGNEIVNVPFEVASVDPQVCTLAQWIVDLTCGEG
jgi:hypothetical protein